MSKSDLLFDSADPTEFFEVLAKLGEGSYGSVYKALDKRDGKLVAIKVLEVENEDTLELQKEINILKECDCEYIVRYKGSYRKDGNIWIVMEFCGAGSLCDLMAICERTLTEEQIAIIMKQSLYGLEYLHAKKKIHRDIKSGNILINHDGDCKLADFGVSAELATTMSKRKTVIGTPYWMAPEVLQSTEYNGKADIWSLAICAIELAVGEPPHSNVHPMRAIFMIPNSDPPTLPDPSKWSADFNDFLKVCLVKNPEKRPTATQLLKGHPFILKAKSKAVIAQLVDECMQEIDEYRAQEAAEAAAAAAAGGDAAGGAGLNGTASARTGGVSGGNTAGVANSGTMVNGGGVGGPGGYDQGTMVFNSGTMIQGAGQDYDDAANDFGTMVLHSATLAKPPPPQALDQTAATGTTRNKYEEPSYMRHIREASNKFKNTPVPTSTGTMLVSGTMVSGTGVGPLTPADFRDLYRTQRKIETTQLEPLTKDDIKATLAALEKAQAAERAQLDATYEATKKMMQLQLEKKQ